MPETPDLTEVRAVALTTSPQLARHLADLHPGVRTALLTRLAGIGTLRDTDALLLLTSYDPDRRGTSPGNGLVTTTLFIGSDLDDAQVWDRAVKLRAEQVLIVPDQDEQLLARLHQHLGAAA